MGKIFNYRFLVALIIGFVFAGTIWVLQPFNNFVLNNSAVADQYLPELGIALMGVLIFIINPLLLKFFSKYSLNSKQLAVIFGIVLVACVPVTAFRIWPHALARTNRDMALNKELADVKKLIDLPDSLYIEPVEFGQPAPAATQFIDELEPGNTIPWGNWKNPLLSWGSMIGLSWLMMIGISLILFPHWRNNERLPFPLLVVQQTLIEKPEKGTFLPAVFRSKIFWTAFVGVVLVHAFNGLNYHTGAAVPPFPLKWDINDALAGGITRHASYFIKTGTIFFSMIGITYFMPRRIAFSLWFFVLLYQVYIVTGFEYSAPFFYDTGFDHRNGATLAIGFVILWLSRSQWLAVLKSMFMPAKNDVDRRNRTAGLMFSIGALGLISWQLWTGVEWYLAALSVFMVTIISIVFARILAETGMPFCASYLGAGYFLNLMPISWLSAKAVYVLGWVDILIREGNSRVSAAVMGMHALGLDKEQKPSSQARLAKYLVVVLLLGIVVVGVVHVYIGYNYRGSVDGVRVPIASWGSGIADSTILGPVKNFARGSWDGAPYNRLAHLVFGFVMGLVLQIASLLSPLWPLHPIGILFFDSWFMGLAWPSIFIGWLLTRSITIYGGAGLYKQMKPFFMGLILGEIFSVILWAAVPVVMILFGANPSDVGHHSIAPL